MPRPPLTIALDGPASSGKGTVARLVASALDYRYVDTGAMYRCVALLGARAGLPLTDGPHWTQLIAGLDFDLRWAEGRLAVQVNGEDLSAAIRTEQVGQGASAVAALPTVRAGLLERQRALGRAGGVVMDGRDIGTVVLPDAQLKVYLDADPKERARRRALEMAARGQTLSEQQALCELLARDAQDSGRQSAPLRQADDAIYLDSTGQPPEAVAGQILALARARGA